MVRSESSESSVETPKVVVPTRRLWAMRVVAMVLMPTLFLLGLEGILRVAGYGNSTGFFEQETVNGEGFYYTNPAFGFRFFPPSVARAPIPQRFVREKEENTFRIFLFGESAANGDPDPAYGVGRFLEVLLEEQFPQFDFEVICTAITAINSHVILPIARDAAKLDGDLWIVYMGNNEMIGPYGASTVFGTKAPSLSVVRGTLALKSTRLGQAIGNLAQNRTEESEASSEWGGINMFAENLLNVNAPERLQVYENFEGNLDDILSAGAGAGIPIILSTVASNLLHSAPFASVNALDLSKEELGAWKRHFNEGKKQEASGTYEAALAAYEAAAEIDPTHAELQYRRGLAYGKMDDLETARELLTLARDLDALPVRADKRINEIIATSAESYSDQVILTDAMELFAQDSFAGLPGRDLFYEHVHFTLSGNYKLARIFADEIVAILPESVREGDGRAWVGQAYVEQRLAATVWDQKRVWTEMKGRLGVPPYNARVGYASQISYAASQADRFSKRIRIQADRDVYERALEGTSDDYLLRARFGRFLVEQGAFDEAIEHLTWICETFPDFDGGFQELGIAQFLAEDFVSARQSFERVLELRPGYGNALKALEAMDSDPRYSGED